MPGFDDTGPIIDGDGSSDGPGKSVRVSSIVLWVSRLLHSSLCAFEAPLLLIADGDGGSDDPRQSVRVSIHRPLGPLPLARRSRPRS